MNDRILELSRIAEDYARNHVRDCETYGYTMFEGTAEDEFHAEYRKKFAESIIQDCLNMCDWETGQRIQKHFEYRDNRWPETELNPKPF